MSSGDASTGANDAEASGEASGASGEASGSASGGPGASLDAEDLEEFTGEFEDSAVLDLTGDVLFPASDKEGSDGRFDGTAEALTARAEWGESLRELVLMNCRLRGEFDFALAGVCPALVRLCLRQNLLRSVSAASLARLSALQRVELRDNELQGVPEGLDLPNLRVLDLSYNEIRSITGLEGLPRLRELFLCQNKIREIGEGIGAVRDSLVELELGGNRIRSIANLGENGFDRLEILWLGKNKIAEISGLGQLPRLRKLDLQANRVTEFSAEGLRPVAGTLRELLISSNGLTSLADVAVLTELELLDVSANRIESLADSHLDKLARLTELWCTSNKLTSFQEVERELGAVPQLVSVMLEANPLARDVQYRNKLLAALPRLTEIDGNEVVHTGVSRLLSGQPS